MTHVNSVEGKCFRGWIDCEVVYFNKVEVGIESRAVIGEGGLIDDVAQGNRSLMDESFPRPDLPDRLSGLTRHSDHVNN
jgi:hypothetical protein